MTVPKYKVGDLVWEPGSTNPWKILSIVRRPPSTMIYYIENNKGVISFRHIAGVDTLWSTAAIAYPTYSIPDPNSQSTSESNMESEGAPVSKELAVSTRDCTVSGHIWLQYTGLMDQFEYCEHCDMRKKDWEEQQNMNPYKGHYWLD